MEQVVKVIRQKAASPTRTNRSIACSLKTFCLNGFKIKRLQLNDSRISALCMFVNARAIFRDYANSRCHLLKRDAAAVRPCVACSLLLE